MSALPHGVVCVLPVLPDSLCDALRHGCQGQPPRMEGRRSQGPADCPAARAGRLRSRSPPGRHACWCQEMGDRDRVTAAPHPGAGGLGPRHNGLPVMSACSGRAMPGTRCCAPPRSRAFQPGSAAGAVRGPSAVGADLGDCAERRGRHPVPGTGAVRGAGVGCCAGIRDHYGQPAAVYVALSFSVTSARRMCFWTLPVAVMGRAETISRRSGSFCVASFCARR